ncbi:hypothetical protein [Brevundimonas nasdae]|uniref:hypothetical protein n=1 Tax=Brevundimonas nasdae TaxID=172043 RepID=UPI003F68D36C
MGFKDQTAVVGLAAGLAVMLAPAAQASAPAQARTASKIDRVFTSAMLGADASVLERVTGRAAQNAASVRYYEVEGCSVQALVTGGKVEALAMETSPRCTFNVDAVVGGDAIGTANIIHFAEIFDNFQDGVLTADCLMMCGNAVEPSIQYTFNVGRRAMTIETVMVSQPDAAEQWQKAMVDAKGRDWVINASFNCDHSFDRVGKGLFRPAQATRIVVWASSPRFACDGPRPI